MKRLTFSMVVAQAGSEKAGKALGEFNLPHGLQVGRDAVAYPFVALRRARVVNDRVGGLPVVIVHQPPSEMHPTTCGGSRKPAR